MSKVFRCKSIPQHGYSHSVHTLSYLLLGDWSPAMSPLVAVGTWPGKTSLHLTQLTGRSLKIGQRQSSLGKNYEKLLQGIVNFH